MIVIRRARQDDVPRIAEVYVETWRTTYAGALPDKVLVGMSVDRQKIAWARALRHGGEIIMVAEDAQAGVVGLGSAGPNRSRGSAFAGEVYTLYIHPDFQEQGIGEKLLGRLFQELMAGGMNSAVIWVLAPNPSRFFYEAMGGRRIGERDETLWGTAVREIAYGWTDLSAALKDGRPEP